MKVILVIFLLLVVTINSSNFKTKQRTYSRVRTAYNEKGVIIKNNLINKNLDTNSLKIYIRVFKQDKIIELWGSDNKRDTFVLIDVFDICSTSGDLGPKRMRGDLQIPEGFYHIDRFNAWSNFYLSLGINYPNRSDRILGKKGNLGGDIFIHGDCVTIGCLPITDDKIKKLYIYCVEAKNNGQLRIPVTIFPVKLNEDKYNQLNVKYTGQGDVINLWNNLKEAYDFFEKNKRMPSVTFLNNGRHKIN